MTMTRVNKPPRKHTHTHNFLIHIHACILSSAKNGVSYQLSFPEDKWINPKCMGLRSKGTWSPTYPRRSLVPKSFQLQGHEGSQDQYGPRDCGSSSMPPFPIVAQRPQNDLHELNCKRSVVKRSKGDNGTGTRVKSTDPGPGSADVSEAHCPNTLALYPPTTI